MAKQTKKEEKPSKIVKEKKVKTTISTEPHEQMTSKEVHEEEADITDEELNELENFVPQAKIDKARERMSAAKEHLKAVVVDEVIKETVNETKEIAKDIAAITFVNYIPTIEEAIAKIEGKTIEQEVREEVSNELKPLSASALQWAKYLKMQGQTPEQFLNQYKIHTMRASVEELYEYEKKLKNKL